MAVHTGHSRVGRMLAVAGGVAFVASLAYFLYAYLQGFGRLVLVDSEPGTTLKPVLTNVGLFTLFALHHSVMARFGPKRWIQATAMRHYERSVYVWISSVLFFIVCAQWQPVPGVLWTASPISASLLLVLQFLGIMLSVRAAGHIDALELSGIRQAFELPDRKAELTRWGAYGFVRHPIYLGWLLLVWATPTMTATRLVFAAISTFYLVVAVPLEERDLVRAFGGAYETYKRDVRWRMIPFVY